MRMVCAGAFHSVALCRSGKVVTWGSNAFGQVRTPFCLQFLVRTILTVVLVLLVLVVLVVLLIVALLAAALLLAVLLIHFDLHSGA